MGANNDSTVSKAVKYPVVEVVSSKASNELGDFAVQKVAARGTTLKAARPRIRLVDSQAKHCLANMVPGLAAATTIVHIPDVTPQGERLDMSEWMEAFWFACGEFGVPMWTQSSLKAKTFYFVKPEMFKKLAPKWNLSKDGPKFAAYAGLLFSEMDSDSEALEVELKSIAKPSNGEDGNCVVDPDVWGLKACQFRLMRLDGRDGLPIALGKGIGVPVKGTKSIKLNSTQVKWGHPGKFVIMRNTNVSARLLKLWVSVEPILMLQDDPQVRRFLAARVKREVADYLALLTQEHRVDLLKRLGGLALCENGELESARRAVIEALRSNLPWCAELENRVTRFAIREITESIIPSGAVEGFASLLVISNKHGVAPCSWQDARYIGLRIPVTGANAIIPLPKDPYVKGKGMVVTAKVAKLASGDADGDLFIVVSDPEVVELFRRFLNHDIVSGLKPSKTRAEAPLTVEFLQDSAIDQVSQSWQVGALNIAGWKMIQEGDVEMASGLLDLANLQPMTQKWDIVFGGRKFAAYVSDLYSKMRKQLAEISLQWRDKAAEARGWSSPREMVNAEIATPSSHVDIAWNAGVEAAKEWAQANPLQPLSLSAVARIAFGENGIVIPGSAWREARELISWWGQYWADVRENRNINADNGIAYRHAAEWAKTASREAIAALLVWRPKNPENNGFSLKWHAVFAGGRAVNVLGIHPLVAEAVKELRGHKVDLERQIALVDALLEEVGVNIK